MELQLNGSWNYPTRILHGPGRVNELADACKNASITRPLIVTDTGLRDSPILEQITKLLVDAGLKAPVFSDVKGNPAGSNVDSGVAAYKANDCDGVIAVGGGSALDVGKCVAFMSGQSRPIWDFEDVDDWWTRANSAGIAPIVAVPTTAGTGSEVGRAAVLTNDEVEVHEKKIIFHPLMLPKVVISDPLLTVNLPPKLTAWTGMDALAHCLEAFCAPGFHPMADGIAVEGARLIKEYLPRAVQNGQDVEARSRMLTAASMGAAAFQKGLGAVHSISHPVGAIYDTHHGMTNGVVMPYVLLFNRTAIESRMAYLARALDLPGENFDAVLKWLLAFRKTLFIPDTLADLKVPESDIDRLSEMAQRDPSTGGNPVKMTPEGFKKLIRMAIRGDYTLEGK
jgi:alcohol dehydrogenase class IV